MEEDFNITGFARKRKWEDRSRKDMQAFNNFISQLDLIDLSLSYLLFTWSNMRPNPAMTKLDKDQGIGFG